MCDIEAAMAWRIPGSRIVNGTGPVVLVGNHLPRPEAALALVGAARRMSMASKSREVRGVDRVVIRDGDTISAL